MTSLTQGQIVDTADRLRTVYGGAEPLAPFSDGWPDALIEDAYAVQEVNTSYWLGEGRRLVGRKIGLTSDAIQSALGVYQPDFGMLFADMGYADGEEVPMNRLCQPRIEGEVAFVMGSDLTGDSLTLTDVLGAVDYALPALEIVDSRISDWKIKIFDTVADNASSGLYVLGATPRSIRDMDLRLCGMVIEHRGEPVSVGAGAACLGHPLNATLWLARKMAEVGRPLKAGDVVLSGALGPMLPVSAGETYELRVSGLGSVRAAFSE